MARVKATSSDINARLAKGECANFVSGGCQGRTLCMVINGEACQYFNEYVKPLLDYPEFAAKYSREAKVAVALNPKAKVVRKRRQAGEPTLAIETKPAAAAPKALATQPIAEPHAGRPLPTPKPRASKAAQAKEQPALLLELAPSGPTRGRTRKR